MEVLENWMNTIGFSHYQDADRTRLKVILSAVNGLTVDHAKELLQSCINGLGKTHIHFINDEALVTETESR